MSEQIKADDSSRNLNIMAAAAEHMTSSADAMSTATADQNHGSPTMALSSPARRMKLVLPNLTPAMQQDLALSKGSGAKSSKPLSIGTRPEFVDYPLKGIVTPHPNDVLCGRGGGSNNHPGNESFRELVNEVKVPYVNCPKREKPLIARRIVEAVRNQTPPGRFLSKDSKGLWNDIGDGKAREKTSQALREGAPIIRDMIGKPSSPNNVASVLKEAKKAERAEKEYGVKLPKKFLDNNDEASLASAGAQGAPVISRASPPVSNMDLTSSFKRGASMGIVPPQIVSNGSESMPPLKKFRSLGERDNFSSTNSGQQPPVQAWPPRNFNMMPYVHPGGHGGHSGHGGQMMGGYAPPPPPPRVDYSSNGMPRYPGSDSVPMETVRRLLLGQLDPIQLALQILPPDDVAIVARRHAASHGLAPGVPVMSRGPYPGPGPTSHPLPLNPMVSDGSSTSSAGDIILSSSPTTTTMHRAMSDQSKAAQSGDDMSSVDSSLPAKKRALPKKKRKYVATEL